MNPGKNDNVCIGKTNGSRVYEQKRYLLWPIRDILEILNGNSLSEESTFVSTFDTELSFSLFYRFLKMHKQYIYNSKITHNSCLCEICENASLLGKGLDNGSKRVQISTDPRGIVERYSCDDEAKDCMFGNCNTCQLHGLSETDVITENNVSSNSDSDSDTGSDVTIKFYHLHKSESGYLFKMQMTLDM